MAGKLTREQTAQARRQLLVEAAAECFAEKGFHQTSMRDLAERAGVSLGNVYNHFASKTDLIAEIARLEADDLQAIKTELDKIDDPAEVLDRFVQLYVKSCAQREHALISAEITSEGLRNPEICGDFLENRRVLAAALADLIRLIRQTQSEPGPVEPDDCAAFLLDLVEGNAIRLAFEGKRPNRRDITILKSAVRQLVGMPVGA